MTETPESLPPTTGYSRLFQVLAWVGIVAGVVFVVAVVFFSGLVVGWSSGGSWHRAHGGYSWQNGQGGPMMGYGGMMGPGVGSWPAGPGGMMRPGQLVPTPTTSVTPRP